MQRRIVTLLYAVVFSVLVLMVTFLVRDQNQDVSRTSNTVGNYPTPIPAQLTTLCNCQIVISNGSQVQLYNPTTGERITAIDVVGEGQSGISDNEILGISPSGRYVMLRNTTSHQLSVIESWTGAKVRTHSIAPDQFVANLTWSPDESVQILVMQHRPDDNEVLVSEETILRWTAERAEVVPVTQPTAFHRHYSLLSVNNTGTDILFGWSIETSLELFHHRVGGTTTKLESAILMQKEQKLVATVVLSGIGYDQAIVSLNGQVLTIDIARDSITILADTAWSGFPLSPLTMDGRYVLVTSSLPGSAHGQIMRYDLLQRDLTELLTPFDGGEGLFQAMWLPAKQVLIFHDAYHQRWLALSNEDTHPELFSVAIPALEAGDTIVGFVKN